MCARASRLSALLLVLTAGSLQAQDDQVTYTAAQLDRGTGLYRLHCARCHGTNLEGNTAAALRGSEFAAMWNSAEVTVDDLHYVIQSTMPPEQPGSLPEADNLAILAVILAANGVPAGDAPLRNQASLLASISLARTADAESKVDFVRGVRGLRPMGAGPDSQALKNAAAETNNWIYHTRDYAGTRYSPLDEINRANVGGLQPVCLNQLGGEGYFQSGPLVYDGVMYLTAGERTVALDAASCRTLWEHRWVYRDRNRETANRGVAIQDGYVVRGTADGYLLALDAADGELLWARQVADPAEGEHFTMAPMIFENRILIGPAGGNYGISGWIGAFRLADGAPVWRFHTVPGATREGGETWDNPLGIRIGGGAVWTPLSLDTETESLYVAVTNPAPDFPSSLRPGENLYTNSILSLNVDTGNLNWYRQLIPADDHGWDLTQVSPLFSIGEGDHARNLVTTVGKDGLLRMLDRDSREQLFATAVTSQLNVDAPVTMEGTYTCPGVLGGVLWNGPALAREQGSLITPSVNLCSTFYRARETRYIEGRDYFGGTVISDPETLSGFVTAVDYRNGEIRWQHRTELPMVAAVTTTAGGLVLTGELGGDFLVLDAGDGNALYRFNTGGAIGGGVITYRVGGRQYIAVASGRPSRYQFNGELGSPTILVFALPE